MKLEKASVKLAYLLRHSKDPLYVSLDGGWAEVSRVLEVLRQTFPWMDRRYLDEIVATDRKGRYSFSEDGRYIRANQGHSIPGIQIAMDSPQPPRLLYHGTATRFLKSILQQGLKPMGRQFVHLSDAYDTAVAVGSCHGEPVVLTVRAEDLAADGYGLYLSDNGVWQTKEVPPQYLSVCETMK